ncbi:MAG: DNA-processing protein DprA [Armatimonadota bacterium]
MKLNDDSWSPARFALMLSCVPNLGEKQMLHVMHHQALNCVPVGVFLHLPIEELQADWGLTEEAAYAISEERHLWWNRFLESDELVKQHGVQIITEQHHLYPQQLNEFCETPPPVLHAAGNMQLITEGWRFAVVCSRDMPSVAGDAADELCCRAIEAGGTLVTGHNTRAYQRAALAALRQDREHIMVLDRGLWAALGPEFNRPLFNAARLYQLQFAFERDLVLSPFPLKLGCFGLSNQRRDELIFALCDVIFAVWVREDGVMQRLCEQAVRLGKRVKVWQSPSGVVSPGGQRILVAQERFEAGGG